MIHQRLKTGHLALATVAVACSSLSATAQSEKPAVPFTEANRIVDDGPESVLLSPSPIELDDEVALQSQSMPALGALNGYRLQTDSTEGWTYEIAPYFFLPAIDGEASLADTTVDLDLSFSDVLDILDEVDDVFGVSLRFEAWKDQKWGYIIDGTYGNIESDFESFDDPPETFNIQLGVAQVDLALGYRIFDQPVSKDGSDWPRLKIDVIGGGRYQYFKQKFKEGTDPSFGDSKDWMELLIGGRAALHLNEKWIIGVQGDISGFGIGSASELTWKVLAGLDYRLRDNISLRAGYLVQGFDYSSGSGTSQFGADWTLQGMYLAMAFRF